MGWAIYLMTSFALLAVGWLVTVFFAKRILVGVMVNAAWLAIAWQGLYYEVRTGDPFVWGFVGAPISFWTETDCALLDADGEQLRAYSGWYAVDLFLWSLPILVFWFLLLRRREPKPSA